MATAPADTTARVEALPPFQNELTVDFSLAENREAMERALRKVRAQLGREYPILVAGESHKTGDLLTSLNPSHPDEVVGAHHKATKDLANRAIEDAYAFFPEWSATPAATRIAMLRRASAIIR